MKRKFRNEVCVYCNDAPAESSDHVVGRKFFLEERRGDLPQAPACEPCNNRKSQWENYLMIVLAFGAKHRDAAVNLQTQVSHRLENKANAKLLRKLQKGYDKSGGTSIPFEHKPLEELCAMIAKALAWQHFGVRLGTGYSSIASIFMNDGERFFAQLLARGKVRVSGNLGEGTFKYEGMQAADCPELTLWRFEIYGGVDFGGDPRVNGRSSLVMAATGRGEMIGNLFYSGFLKDRNAPKVGRNDPCPCGGGKKHKKCHGSVAKIEARERAYAKAAASRVVPSTYQPLAAHGYGPHQFAEMIRFAQQIRPARRLTISRRTS
jgi:SEC-C motif-containing protein